MYIVYTLSTTSTTAEISFLKLELIKIRQRSTISELSLKLNLAHLILT